MTDRQTRRIVRNMKRILRNEGVTPKRGCLLGLLTMTSRWFT